MQEFTQPSQNFDKSLWLDKELEIRGIYLKTKVIKLVASSTGDKTVACGFPPKLVLASCRDSLESCSGSSDFETSFSIRNYDNSWTFSTGDYTELVNLSTLTWDVANRLQNWFIFTISSFSWGSKNIYFTCFQ